LRSGTKVPSIHLAALERLTLLHKPRVFFTQPRLQSPTVSVAQLAHLHRLKQLAEKHDLVVVENDLYADLDPEPRPSLASLDQLARVVDIGSYSKAVSPNLHVGFMAAHPYLIEDLAHLKSISGLTSSEFSEPFTPTLALPQAGKAAVAPSLPPNPMSPP
jgi:DNA-binding transcriptional MocR family regulator